MNGCVVTSSLLFNGIFGSRYPYNPDIRQRSQGQATGGRVSGAVATWYSLAERNTNVAFVPPHNRQLCRFGHQDAPTDRTSS